MSTPAPLPLEAARYEWRDNYPLLVLTIAGREAVLDTEWRPALRAAGIVSLGSEFADLVPDIPFQPADGGLTVLRGFTRDPSVYRLKADFRNADSITPGPIPIPH